MSTQKPARDPDYTIQIAKSIQDLRILVIEYMRDGWRPCGGVAVDKDGWLLQALAKGR